MKKKKADHPSRLQGVIRASKFSPVRLDFLASLLEQNTPRGLSSKILVVTGADRPVRVQIWLNRAKYVKMPDKVLRANSGTIFPVMEIVAVIQEKLGSMLIRWVLSGSSWPISSGRFPA